jgi:hypothetical protein
MLPLGTLPFEHHDYSKSAISREARAEDVSEPSNPVTDDTHTTKYPLPHLRRRVTLPA